MNQNVCQNDTETDDNDENSGSLQNGECVNSHCEKIFATTKHVSRNSYTSTIALNQTSVAFPATDWVNR